ncbi:hypothetical protein FNF29_03961 [Cafeteria roenbergensis]|uniref:PDEase domain-containing protein n=1 Tax=Cafeteria roenbergensis TaxID=33653 RepID=A0A5A8CH79_CAFRO|nr:hypothetical protein FNF29_03961 [Cafeteria roenbergensis]|eukprot:KAA0152395.1 hypothetical protein FNF29_03961 [Cafeteria roenbergensis]
MEAEAQLGTADSALGFVLEQAQADPWIIKRLQAMGSLGGKNKFLAAASAVMMAMKSKKSRRRSSAPADTVSRVAQGWRQALSSDEGTPSESALDGAEGGADQSDDDAEGAAPPLGTSATAASGLGSAGGSLCSSRSSVRQPAPSGADASPVACRQARRNRVSVALRIAALDSAPPSPVVGTPDDADAFDAASASPAPVVELRSGRSGRDGHARVSSAGVAVPVPLGHRRNSSRGNLASSASTPSGAVSVASSHRSVGAWPWEWEIDVHPGAARRIAALIASLYRGNLYHSALHAADVLHAARHALVSGGLGARLAAPSRVAFVLAAAAHDAGHPGVNNIYLTATAHPLALRYGDASPLERMHAASLLELVHACPEADVMSSWSATSRRAALKLAFQCIVHTDNAGHFAMVDRLKARGALITAADDSASAADAPGHSPDPRGGPLDLSPGSEDEQLVAMASLHAADISNPYRHWELNCRWGDFVTHEFWLQGRREHAAGVPVGPANDATAAAPKPFVQAGFAKAFCLPLLCGVAGLGVVDVQPWVDQLQRNVATYECLARHVRAVIALRQPSAAAAASSGLAASTASGADEDVFVVSDSLEAIDEGVAAEEADAEPRTPDPLGPLAATMAGAGRFPAYLEYVGNGSNKFYSIERDGTRVVMRNGRNGYAGVGHVKNFASDAQAEGFAHKQLAAKLGKGYILLAPDVFELGEAEPLPPAPAGPVRQRLGEPGRRLAVRGSSAPRAAAKALSKAKAVEKQAGAAAEALSGGLALFLRQPRQSGVWWACALPAGAAPTVTVRRGVAGDTGRWAIHHFEDRAQARAFCVDRARQLLANGFKPELLPPELRVAALSHHSRFASPLHASTLTPPTMSFREVDEVLDGVWATAVPAARARSSQTSKKRGGPARGRAATGAAGRKPKAAPKKGARASRASQESNASDDDDDDGSESDGGGRGEGGKPAGEPEAAPSPLPRRRTRSRRAR